MIRTRFRIAARFVEPVVIGGGALLFAMPAYAYLDPATGSVLLQGLLAGIAGLMVVLRLYWSQVKAFFRRLRGQTELPAEEPKVADRAISEQTRQ